MVQIFVCVRTGRARACRGTTRCRGASPPDGRRRRSSRSRGRGPSTGSRRRARRARARSRACADRPGSGARAARSGRRRPSRRPPSARRGSAAEFAHRVVHALALRLPVVGALRQAQPHDQAAVVVGPVEGEAGGVRAAVAHGLAHPHERRADRSSCSWMPAIPHIRRPPLARARHQSRRGLVRLGDVDADELPRALGVAGAERLHASRGAAPACARAARAPPGRSG